MFCPDHLRRASREPTDSRFHFFKGRVALYALLRALKVGPSDEVIVPVYTCPAVIEPVVGLGARAIYCDIERESFGLNPEEVTASFTDRTKAIVIQHTFGVPGRLEDVLMGAQARRVPILEDCCHVSSSTYRGQPLGRLGDAAFYSHAWEKPLSVGGGGVAVVNSRWFVEAVEETYSFFSPVGLGENARLAAMNSFVSTKRFVRHCLPIWPAGLSTRPRCEPVTDKMPSTGHQLGSEYGKRMPKVYKGRLCRLLNNTNSRVSARKWAIERYEAGFRAIGIGVFENPEYCNAVLWRYPLVAGDKPRLLEEARRHRVELSDWGTIPLRSLAKSSYGDGRWTRRFPVAEDIARCLVTLSIEERRCEAEINRTLEFLSTMKNWGLL